MILIDKPKLKFLLAGRAVNIEVSSPRYTKGRVYSVGLRHSRTICRAEVLTILTLENGYELRLKHWTQDKAVYLAANPGAIRADYTSNPARAARERDGSPIEAVAGEDLKADPWLERVVKQARERDVERKRTQKLERPRAARIAALERAADAGDQQAKRHLFVIDQRISAAERQQPRKSAG